MSRRKNNLTAMEKCITFTPKETDMKKIFLGLLIILTACSTASAITLTETNAAQTAEIKLGNIIKIKLKANATTGYNWHYTLSEPNAFKILSESYTTDKHPQGMVGAGGYHIYQVKPLKKGLFTITARYYRPWEEFNTQTDKELIFKLNIQ